MNFKQVLLGELYLIDEQYAESEALRIINKADHIMLAKHAPTQAGYSLAFIAKLLAEQFIRSPNRTLKINEQEALSTLKKHCDIDYSSYRSIIREFETGIANQLQER